MSVASSGGGSVCGDDVCNGSETCEVCQDDCGQCFNECGDLVCGEGESITCPQDCNGQSSSTGSRGECPADACQAGGTADGTCMDSCVVFICSVDATCCDGGTWNQVCADYAVQFSSFGFCTC